MTIGLNRSGANRLVFLTSGYAIKVPRPSSWPNFLYGLLNNLNEKRDSRLSGRCPVIASLPFGLAIIMPRAEILTQIEFGAFDYHTFCRDHRIKAECKPDSFGRLNGQVVAVDYGW